MLPLKVDHTRVGIDDDTPKHTPQRCVDTWPVFGVVKHGRIQFGYPRRDDSLSVISRQS